MKNIINTIIAIVLFVIFAVGSLFTVIGVQCLNSTTPTTAILSIGAGLMLLAVSLWCFPFINLMDWWKKYTDRMTKEGANLPLVQKEITPVKIYTEEEMEEIIDRVMNKHLDEICNLNLAFESEMLKAKEEIKHLKHVNANKTFLIDVTCKRAESAEKWRGIYQRKNELLLIEKGMYWHAARKAGLHAHVVAKMDRTITEMEVILRDARIKTDGNCPEQIASFNSIRDLLIVMNDSITTMWIKNHI